MSDKEGVCQAPGCLDFAKPLQTCDCVDGEHGASEAEDEIPLEE